MYIVFNTNPVNIKDTFSFRVERHPLESGEVYRLWTFKRCMYEHPESQGGAVVPVDEESLVEDDIAESHPLFGLVKMLYLNQRQIAASFRNRLDAMDLETDRFPSEL